MIKLNQVNLIDDVIYKQLLLYAFKLAYQALPVIVSYGSVSSNYYISNLLYSYIKYILYIQLPNAPFFKWQVIKDREEKGYVGNTRTSTFHTVMLKSQDIINFVL